jgi:hypothetical protein
MFKISLSDGLAVGGIVFTIIFVVLDKAGKLKGPALFFSLAVAAAMTLPLALGNSWVYNAPSGLAKSSRAMLMVCIIGIFYSIILVWISTPTEEKALSGTGSSRSGIEHSQSNHPTAGEKSLPELSVVLGAFRLVPTGKLRQDSIVIVTANIVNTGAPTIVHNLNLLITIGSNAISGTVMSDIPQTINFMKDEKIRATLRYEDYLPRKCLLPIMTGGSVSGWYAILVRDLAISKINQAGNKIILHFTDGYDKAYDISHALNGLHEAEPPSMRELIN